MNIEKFPLYQIHWFIWSPVHPLFNIQVQMRPKPTNRKRGNQLTNLKYKNMTQKQQQKRRKKYQQKQASSSTNNNYKGHFASPDD